MISLAATGQTLSASANQSWISMSGGMSESKISTTTKKTHKGEWGAEMFHLQQIYPQFLEQSVWLVDLSELRIDLSFGVFM